MRSLTSDAYWLSVVGAMIRDAAVLGIYEPPDGDGLRSVAAPWVSVELSVRGRTVPENVSRPGTLNFRL